MTTFTATSRTCGEPLPWETLVDYWVGELPEAAAVEEHFFACASCAERLAALAALVGGLQAAFGGAGDQPVVRQETVDALAAQGKRITNVRVLPGERVRGAIPPDTDFMLARLAADLTGLAQLDVEFCGPDGQPFFAVRDAPFDPRGSEVLVPCHRHVAASHPQLLFRLIGTTAGGRQTTAEYLFVQVAP